MTREEIELTARLAETNISSDSIIGIMLFLKKKKLSINPVIEYLKNSNNEDVTEQEILELIYNLELGENND